MKQEIANILFGKNVSRAAVIASDLIVRHIPANMASLHTMVETLLDHEVIREADNRDFANIIEAVALRFGNYMGDLPRIILNALIDDRLRIPKTPIGLVLGLFRSVKNMETDRDLFTRLNRESGDSKVCEIFVELIFGDTEFKDDNADHVSSQKAKLSEAVAAFIRPSSVSQGLTGKRLADAVNMLLDVDVRLGQGQTLSPFGTVLVDEFCNKIFRDISTKGRVTSIVELHRSTVTPRSKGPTVAAISKI